MNSSKYIFLWTLAAIAFQHCTPDPLEVNNVPTLSTKIVVSSQVIPDQSIAVLLTRSISALDAGSSTNADTLLNSIIIEDATVVIQWRDQTDTLSYLGNGVYGSTTTAIITGETYTLTASTLTLGTVTSTTKMNAFVPFDSVSARLKIVGNDTLGEIHYAFTDPPGSNWYMLNVQRYRNPKTNLLSNLNPRIFIKALTDDEFSGQRKSETFTIPFRRFHDGDTVSVVLANISEEYYNYIKTRIDGQNSISEFVSEPLNLPTNVEGGYGYFNMQIPDLRIFKMKP